MLGVWHVINLKIRLEEAVKGSTFNVWDGEKKGISYIQLKCDSYRSKAALLIIIET